MNKRALSDYDRVFGRVQTVKPLESVPPPAVTPERLLNDGRPWTGYRDEYTTPNMRVECTKLPKTCLCDTCVTVRSLHG